MLTDTWSAVRTVEPAAEPLDLAGIKLHLRVDANDTSQDQVLNDLITEARRRFEDLTSLALITQTWRLNLDLFWRRDLLLPRGPLQSVTSIKYVDTLGVQQTLDPSKYLLDTDALPPRIQVAWAAYWPPYRYQANTVQVTFVAGYGASGSSVPGDILGALRQYVAYRWENREQADPEILSNLCLPFAIGDQL